MNVIGYSLLWITFLFFIGLIYQKIKKQKQSKKKQVIGYVLLEKTAEKKIKGQSTYFGVFQQAEKEWVLELTREQFLKWQPPVRGYLSLDEQRIDQFEI